MTPEREQELLDEVARWKQECELLRQKLDLVLRKLFGKSSEALDPAQLELLLGEPPGKLLASLPPDGAPEEASASSVARTERKPRRERILDLLAGRATAHAIRHLRVGIGDPERCFQNHRHLGRKLPDTAVNQTGSQPEGSKFLTTEIQFRKELGDEVLLLPWSHELQPFLLSVGYLWGGHF